MMLDVHIQKITEKACFRWIRFNKDFMIKTVNMLSKVNFVFTIIIIINPDIY